jgi:ABC-type transport system substrate-binding protein
MQTNFSPKISTLFGDNNIANYNNEEMFKILNDISSTSSYSNQINNYDNLYDRYLEDMPYIFLYRATDSVVYNQTLCGKISPNAYSIFYNVEKWYRQ